ncbi:MAG: hypothetical protein HY200_07235 [Nitrospirae bacterium]|nr:hypothetical protein [Nitrospirota bacterium]MBI3594736.1 hypothetical protein [Nitrospirota bacterium]
MKIGLWIQDSTGNEFLICKDSRGYPHLISFHAKEVFFQERGAPQVLSIEEGKKLYQEMTGKAYPFGHATTRQVLWDLIEAALKQLP